MKNFKRIASDLKYKEKEQYKWKKIKIIIIKK